LTREVSFLRAITSCLSISTKQELNRLKEIITETLKKWDCELLEFNGEIDISQAKIGLKI
jgi:hypothetical protein